MTRRTPALSIALAAAALCPGGSAFAQSTVSVYGLVDMSVGQFEEAGGRKDKAVESGAMSTSFLGFKGSEDLSGGLKAVFALEHFLRADTGTAGRGTGDAFWARNAYVGLSGAFGTTTLGRQSTPLFNATRLFNPFGESFGFSPSIRHYYGDTPFSDRAWSNAIGYISNNLDGFTVNVMGSPDEGAATAKGRNLGANVLYFGKAFSAALAWEDARNSTIVPFPALIDKQTTVQLGTAYDFGPAKLYGQLGRVKTAKTAAGDARTKLFDLGASVPVGSGQVLTAWGYSQTKFNAMELTLRTLSLGYDHNLSKHTDVYAVYMNDRDTVFDDDGDTFAVGIRHKF